VAVWSRSDRARRGLWAGVGGLGAFAAVAIGLAGSQPTNLPPLPAPIASAAPQRAIVTASDDDGVGRGGHRDRDGDGGQR
jgi:hypothetical protein